MLIGIAWFSLLCEICVKWNWFL